MLPQQKPVPGLFEHVLIQTNSQCTLKCSFCLYGMKGVEVKNTDMSDELFNKIVDELAALDYSGRVSLFEINEPLLDEKILQRIRTVKERVPKSWQCISTNGDLLTAELAVQLIEAGLDYLAVNSYSYAAFRKAKALRKQLPERVGAKVIHTERFNPDFAKDNRGGNISAISTLIEPLNESCSRINHVLYIKPDGKVVSCFGDFFSKNVMGNANNQHVLDIWFGEQFTTMRSHLDKGDRTRNELCSKCNIGEKGDYLESYKVLEPLAKKSGKLRGAVAGNREELKRMMPFLNRYSRISYIIDTDNDQEDLLSLVDYSHEVQVSGNYSKMFTDPVIDYVFVSNENELHYEIALKALRSGIPVLLEKPLALTKADFINLIEICCKKDVLVVFPEIVLIDSTGNIKFDLENEIKNMLWDSPLPEVMHHEMPMEEKQISSFLELIARKEKSKVSAAEIYKSMNSINAV